MDARRTAAMAEATRLTRRGRLVEATALIQRTLTSPATPREPEASSGGEGTQLEPVHSGWLTRRVIPRRALPRRVGQGLRRPRRPAAPVLTRPPGRFEAFSYSGAAGHRDYRLYLPGGRDDGPLPLVVMLHGGTQNAATFAAATGMNDLAERHGFLVAYPQQPGSANPGKFWNWFVPAHQRRDAGEPSLIAGITRQVAERYGADATRVYVAGFSAGGAMAAVMAAVYPDLYAAVGVHSGVRYAAASDVASGFAAMKKGPSRPARLQGLTEQPRPLIVFQGDRDKTVALANAAGLIDDVLAAASADGRPRTPPAVTAGQVPGGHAYTRTCYQDRAGATLAESWIIHQGGHAWSGGAPHGSYTDASGPDASAEFIRFFNEHPAAPPTRHPGGNVRLAGA